MVATLKIFPSVFGNASSLLIKSADTERILGLCPFTGWLMLIVRDSLLISVHVMPPASPGSAPVSLRHCKNVLSFCPVPAIN